MAQINSVIAGKYEILTELGRGGMSVVYLVIDRNLGKQWALKEIKKKGKSEEDEAIFNSLLVEADLMKKLDHPAFPRIVDIFENEDTIQIVMDFIEGKSLDKVLEEEGAQQEAVVISWAKQLCEALSYLHSRKPPIIYRDMKPANVMMRDDGDRLKSLVKVFDFGIAREYKDNKLQDTKLFGTRGYASPEHSGVRQTDARSDIYTLGMTMHHLLTGQDPREPGYEYASVRQWNPKLSEGIEIIIDKCTAEAQKDRYQSCEELMYDLEHPNDITGAARRKKRAKIGVFATSLALSVLMGITGVVCNIQAANIRNNDYEELISVVSSLSDEERVESYKKAIDIYPGDARAYLKILDVYEEDEILDEEEAGVISSLYNSNKSSFDMTSKEVAELNYRIGFAYFAYYTEKSGIQNEDEISDKFNDEIRERIYEAKDYFEYNIENQQSIGEYEYKNLSNCFYYVCHFYDTYLNSSTVEVKKENYEEFITTIEAYVEDIREADLYKKLSFSNVCVIVINNQADKMSKKQVEKNKILDLLEKLNSLATDEEGVNNKDRQEKFIETYINCVENVEAAYSSTKGEE